MIFAFIIVFLEKNGVLQIYTCLTISVIFFFLTICLKPYFFSLSNWAKIISDFMIIVIFIFMGLTQIEI